MTQYVIKLSLEMFEMAQIGKYLPIWVGKKNDTMTAIHRKKAKRKNCVNGGRRNNNNNNKNIKFNILLYESINAHKPIQSYGIYAMTMHV